MAKTFAPYIAPTMTPGMPLPNTELGNELAEQIGRDCAEHARAIRTGQVQAPDNRPIYKRIHNAEAIIKHARANGGATFTRELELAGLTHGYLVSVPGELTDSDLSVGLLRLYTEEVSAPTYHEWSDVLPGSVYYGVWQNPESGAWHYDVSLRFDDRAKAIALGMAWGQVCVWDVAKGESILMADQKTEAPR